MIARVSLLFPLDFSFDANVDNAPTCIYKNSYVDSKICIANAPWSPAKLLNNNELLFRDVKMSRLSERIPKKFQDISSLAFVFAGYFFIFDDGKEYPIMTIIGASAGAWGGYEFGMYIVRIVRRNKSK